MTTDSRDDGDTNNLNLDKMGQNLARVEELTQRLLGAISNKNETRAALQGPDNDMFLKAATTYVAEMMANPTKVFENQIGYWGKSVEHYVAAQKALTDGHVEAPKEPTAPDRRFVNPMWDSHPYFFFLKQQYLLNAEAVGQAIDDIETLDPREKKRIEYFSRQIVDMFSPANFLGTNPDALTRAVETEGESLVRGLENLVADLEANEGDLLVTLADKDAFQVGGNLATTPGKVVFRNRMLELIQYSPTTPTVQTVPLLIFPPWINKFYILDMKSKNSLVKWLVEQGYSVFVVSWINPDRTYADVALDGYIQEGYLEAIAQVKTICDVENVNAVGYCIGGTTLSLTAALLAKRGDTSLNSVTLFTALTDFSDQGEVGVFLNDDFIDGIEAECDENGMLRSYFMTRTFSYLRSNDLIYGPAIKSYMMGESPPAFDLLFWNGDATNLPGKMAVQYLRDLCQGDQFANGGIEICGETLHLAQVDVPLCAIACETDHIAAWKSSYSGVQQMTGERMFILSQSGHIAGIINPPSKMKYGHYTNADLSVDAESWYTGAEFSEGSWWGRWSDWLRARSGDSIESRVAGANGVEILCDAPGEYVGKTPKR